MTIEEYKEQVFKYDSNCEPVRIKEVWGSLTRRQRREIERILKKGRIPDIIHYL